MIIHYMYITATCIVYNVPERLNITSHYMLIKPNTYKTNIPRKKEPTDTLLKLLFVYLQMHLFLFSVW